MLYGASYAIYHMLIWYAINQEYKKLSKSLWGSNNGCIIAICSYISIKYPVYKAI